jgi:hypothetical protein
MPAYAKPETGLTITFWRDGKEHDHRVAPDGVRAVSAAMRMLAMLDELQSGDRLTVGAVIAAADNPAA